MNKRKLFTAGIALALLLLATAYKVIFLFLKMGLAQLIMRQFNLHNRQFLNLLVWIEWEDKDCFSSSLVWIVFVVESKINARQHLIDSSESYCYIQFFVPCLSGLDTYFWHNLPLWKVCLKIYFSQQKVRFQNEGSIFFTCHNR